MKEKTSIGYQDSETLATKFASGDVSGVRMTGQCIDRIYKNGVLVDEIVGHNLVVTSFLKLIMCLLKRENGHSGIQYWAVGSGASSWDSNTPSPTLDNVKLTAELGRIPVDPNNIIFLNSNYERSNTPTNIIQVTCSFAQQDCNGVWREFALFGGNATTEKDSGIMINKRHHAILTKTNEMTVERIMRFTINLSSSV